MIKYVFSVVVGVLVVGSVLAIEGGISLSPLASPSASLTPPEEASSSAQLDEQIATDSAEITPTPTPAPTTIPTITPAPTIAVPLANPLTRLWDVIIGNEGQTPVLGDPPTAESLYWREQSADYIVAAGKTSDDINTLWIRSTRGNDEWQPIQTDLHTEFDGNTRFTLYESGIFWLNTKRSALYRYDMQTQGVESSFYQPSQDEIELYFVSDAGENMTATYLDQSQSFQFAVTEVLSEEEN